MFGYGDCVVDGSPILTSARQLNFDQLPETLVRLEPGRKQVLGVEGWAEIRRLRRCEGLPIAEIGRLLGISRNTVKAALVSDGPPQYRRAPAGSVVDVAAAGVSAAGSGVADDVSAG